MKRQLKILEDLSSKAEAYLAQLRKIALALLQTNTAEQQFILLTDYAVQLDQLRHITPTIAANAQYINEKSKYRNDAAYQQQKLFYKQLAAKIQNTAAANQLLKAHQYTIDKQKYLDHGNAIPNKQLILTYWGLPDFEKDFRELNQQQLINQSLVETYTNNLFALSRLTFSRITREEWSNPSKYGNASYCPNMMAAANTATAITYYVVENILQQPAIAQRTLTYEFWVHVAHASLARGDFFSAGAITSAFISEGIGRLSRTKEGLSSKAQQQLNELLDLYSLQGNFAKLRKAQSQFTGALVPSLLYLAKDMVLELDRVEPANKHNSELLAKTVADSLRTGKQTIADWQAWANTQVQQNLFGFKSVYQGVQQFFAEQLASWSEQKLMAYLNELTAFISHELILDDTIDPSSTDDFTLPNQNPAELKQAVSASLTQAKSISSNLQYWLEIAKRYHLMANDTGLRAICEAIHTKSMELIQASSTDFPEYAQRWLNIASQPAVTSQPIAVESIIADLTQHHEEFATHKISHLDRKIAKNTLATITDYQARLAPLSQIKPDENLPGSILAQATDDVHLKALYQKSVRYEPREENLKPEASKIIQDFINTDNLHKPLAQLNAKLSSSEQMLAQFSGKLDSFVQDITTGQKHSLTLRIALEHLQQERRQLLSQFKGLNEIAHNYQAQLLQNDRTAIQILTTEQQLSALFSQTTAALNTLARQNKQLIHCSVTLAQAKSTSKQLLWRCSGHSDNAELIQLISPLLQKFNPAEKYQVAEEELFIPCEFFNAPAEILSHDLAAKVKIRYEYTDQGLKLLSYAVDVYDRVAERLMPSLKELIKQAKISINMPEAYAKQHFAISTKQLQKCNELYTHAHSIKKQFERDPTMLQATLVTDPLYDLPEYLLKTPASFTYEAWQSYSQFEIRSELDKKLDNAIQNYCSLRIEPDYQALLQINESSQIKQADLHDPRNLYADQYPELSNALVQTIKQTQQWLMLNPHHSATRQMNALHMRLLIDEINITYNYYQLFYRQIEPNNCNDRLVLLDNLKKELLKYQENLAREKFNLQPKQFDTVANLIQQHLHILHTETQHVTNKLGDLAKPKPVSGIDQRVAEPIAAMTLSKKLNKSYASDILIHWVIANLRLQQLMELPDSEQTKLEKYREKLLAFNIELEDNFKMLQQPNNAALQQQLCLERVQKLQELHIFIDGLLADPSNNKTLRDGNQVFKLFELRIPKAALDYKPGDPLPAKRGIKFNLKQAIARETQIIERFQQQLNKHIIQEAKINHEMRGFTEHFSYSLTNEAAKNPHVRMVQRLVTALATCGLRSAKVNTPLYEYLNDTPITISFGQQLDKKITEQASMVAFLNYITKGLENVSTSESLQALLSLAKPLVYQSKLPIPTVITDKPTKPAGLWGNIKGFLGKIWTDNESLEQPIAQKTTDSKHPLPQTISFNFPYNQLSQQAVLTITINTDHTMQLAFNFPAAIQPHLTVTGKKEIFIDTQEILHLSQEAKGYTFHSNLMMEPPQNARIHDRVVTHNHLLSVKSSPAQSEQPLETEKVLHSKQQSIEPSSV